MATCHPKLSRDSVPNGTHDVLKMSGQQPTCNIFRMGEEVPKKTPAENFGVTSSAVCYPNHRFRNPPRPCSHLARPESAITTNSPPPSKNSKTYFSENTKKAFGGGGKDRGEANASLVNLTRTKDSASKVAPGAANDALLETGERRNAGSPELSEPYVHSRPARRASGGSPQILVRVVVESLRVVLVAECPRILV